MTSQIPDQVSHNDLKKLLEVEVPDLDEDQALYDGFTTEELVDLCNEAKDALFEKCHHPMVHKVMAMLNIEHCLEFHNDVGARHYDEGLPDALAWARDAGNLEAVRRLFADVSMGRDDWFVGWDFTSPDDICPECQGDS